MTTLAPARRWLAVVQWPRLEPLTIVPPLVMLHLLLGTPDAWQLRTPLVMLFVLGLAIRRWLNTPAYWYVAATLMGVGVYVNWPTADNHHYLFVYACLALCCSLSLPRAEQSDALALSSRWLIGLCMLFSVAWKVGNPAYLDGSFFHYTLLVDERFAHFTAWLGSTPLELLNQNRELRTALVAGHLQGTEPMSVQLASSPHIALLAQGLTWWTVGIEGLLAIAWLLPDRRGTALVRNVLLLVFALSTYSVAPVRGFGWMLMLLGLAQCGERERSFRWAYLAALLAIQVLTLPWIALFEWLKLL